MNLTKNELVMLGTALSLHIRSIEKDVQYNLASQARLKDTQELYYKIQEELKKKLARSKQKAATKK